jgi:lipid-A-disaccharide synthase-like uncharacterized protein
VGLAGQALFSARFLVQWIASERRRKSTVPRGFWYLSVAGGVVLLGYAIYRRDLVFILGQGGGLLIYCRNLWLIHQPAGGDGQGVSSGGLGEPGARLRPEPLTGVNQPAGVGQEPGGP